MKRALSCHRSSRAVVEEMENRLLLTAGPDLAIAYVNTGFAQTPIVPGDKGVVTVNVTNVGGALAKGSMKVDVWASTDKVYGAGDLLVGSRRANGSLAPGAGTGDFNVNVTIPPTAGPGDYYMLIGLTSTMADPDVNPGNDVTSSGGTGHVSWVFGTVGARKNIRLTVNDAGGLVTFALSGPGQGVVTPGSGGNSFDDVTVTGSTAASGLNVTTTKNAYTKIGTVHVLDDAGVGTGRMKSIQAKNVDLETGVTVDGWLGSLTLHDISSITHYITLNVAGTTIAANQTFSLTAHGIYGCTIDTGDIPIKSFAAADVSATDITAPWIGSLNVKGKLAGEGDFSGSLKLDGADAKSSSLATLSVTGALDATNIEAFADVGAITAGQWDSGSLDAGHVKALTVKGDMGATIDVYEVKSTKISGNLHGTWDATWLTDVNVGGDLTNAVIDLVAVGPPDGRPNIRTLTVKGWIDSSTITADTDMLIGTVTAGGMQDSLLLAGVSPAEFPDANADFTPAHPSTIQKVLIKGMKDAGGAFLDSYINSSIAAWTLGDVTLNDVAWANGGTLFGLACHSLGKYLVKDDGGQHTNGDWIGTTNPADPPQVVHGTGDYRVRIMNGA